MRTNRKLSAIKMTNSSVQEMFENTLKSTGRSMERKIKLERREGTATEVGVKMK